MRFLQLIKKEVIRIHLPASCRAEMKEEREGLVAERITLYGFIVSSRETETFGGSEWVAYHPGMLEIFS